MQKRKSTAETHRTPRQPFGALIGLAAIAGLAFVPPAALAQQTGSNSSSASSTQSTSNSATSAPAAPVDPLAAAARKAREQQSQVKKPAKVFTNDNLPTAGGISTVGVTNAGAGAQETAAAPAGQGEKYWRDKFASLNKKLEQDESELDVMQRELGVLNLQNYSDPVQAMQQGYSRSDIDKKTADIDAKQKEIDADKQAISDAEDDLRKSGGDPGWAR